MLIFSVSQASGGSYCERYAQSGAEPDRAKLIFIW